MKSKLKRQISGGKIDAVIEELRNHFKNRAAELYNLTYVIESRYKEHKKKEIAGIQDSKIEYNEIVFSLISLIDRIEEKDHKTSALHDIDPVIAEIMNYLGVNNEQVGLLAYHVSSNRFPIRYESTIINKTGWTSEDIRQLIINYPSIFKNIRMNDGKVTIALERKHYLYIRERFLGS